jgi:hypothetical protein
MTMLPVKPAHQLTERPEAQRWLIEGLWGAESVGIIGGEPKCCKSILALSLCVAVASGAKALGRFPTPKTGRVLLFAAEDAEHIVRSRLDSIARAAGLALPDLDILVITVPTLRLDDDVDRARLTATIEALRPILLLLDPFVRLHRRIDENASGEVAPLLAYLRELQRAFAMAVMLVHHAKKGAANARAGQALRGSSEFHAWGDSNLYLRRHDDRLSLSIEHRAAPSTSNIPLALRGGDNDGQPLSLGVLSDAEAETTNTKMPAERILRALAQAGSPLSVDAIRQACRMRSAVLCTTLAELASQRLVLKTNAGYVAAPTRA